MCLIFVRSGKGCIQSRDWLFDNMSYCQYHYTWIAVKWQNYLIFRASVLNAFSSIHSNAFSVWPLHIVYMQENKWRETVSQHTFTIASSLKTPWVNDGGTPKRLGGQEEVGLIAVAVATDRGDHETGTDVLSRSPGLVRKQSVAVFIWEEKRRETSYLSWWWRRKCLLQLTLKQLLAIYFIIYEFMTCTDIHFSPLSHERQNGL